MSNGWDDLTASPTITASNGNGKAPIHWLVIGVVATIVILAVYLLFQPQGDFIIAGGLIFWALSMISYLVPFWLSVDGDLKVRSSSTYYYSNPKTISVIRGVYLAFGIVMSLVFVYGVADELSRIVNTVN